MGNKIVRSRVLLSSVLLAGICSSALVGCSTPDASIEQSSNFSNSSATTTTPVTRGDVTDAKRIAGSFGFGPETTFTSAGTGTITRLPSNGDVIGRDGQLYVLDEKPVRSMHGTIPLYRPLEAGLRGADIEQLNSNLRALGYDAPEGDLFSAKTRAAVVRWQKDRGLPQTGTLNASDIAFVPGDIRVGKLASRVGDNSGGVLYGYTLNKVVVTANIPTADLAKLSVGTKVEIELPDGSQKSGTVQTVGSPSGAGEEKSGEGNTTQVTVMLDEVLAEGELNLSSARIIITGESRHDVLSVPVTALMASNDGYYVEVKQKKGTNKKVPVKTGLFAQGLVEISASDLSEGDEVVVPS